MNAATGNRQWIAPAACMMLAVALWGWFARLSDVYQAHNTWPVLLVISAFVLFLYGAGTLFWSAIPPIKVPQTLFVLGIALALLCWLGLHTVPGAIIGLALALLGAAATALQPRQ